MNIRTTSALRAARLPLGALLFAITSLPGAAARAQDTASVQGVRIGLTYTAGTRPGVYVLPMAGEDADSIRAVITRDLDFGDRISVIAPDSGEIPAGPLNYPLYARLGAAAVLQLSHNAAGGLKVVLHEVGAGKVMNAVDFTLVRPLESPEGRLALHAVSDEIERWVTGVTGIAATRIMFERGGSLWVVDSDGANARPVAGTANGQSPAWHPTGTSIAFHEMADDGTHIVLRDLRAGTSRRVSSGGGTNITPAFSPDGKTLVYASGLDGVDLLSMQVVGGEAARRVTVGRGSTNASPTFSPDGRRVAFTSNRTGHAEIYITDSDGADTELLTTSGFGDQLYRADPSWSPDGRFVAFSTQVEGRFQIATIALRDRSVKQHTIDGVNQDPSWSPDARHLVFASTRSGTRQLWVLDTESGRMRQLTHGNVPARYSAWSPRLMAAARP
jgi:TolB protein